MHACKPFWCNIWAPVYNFICYKGHKAHSYSSLPQHHTDGSD